MEARLADRKTAIPNDVFSDAPSVVNAVAHELRLDKHDDFRTLFVHRFGAGQVSEELNVIQSRNSLLCVLILLTDKTSEQHDLPTAHSYRGTDAPLRNGWSQGLLIRVDHVRDLLLDLQLDGPICMHVRQDFQDDAGIAHLDRVTTGVFAFDRTVATPVEIGISSPERRLDYTAAKPSTMAARICTYAHT
jgi:hypothetical protein